MLKFFSGQKLISICRSQFNLAVFKVNVRHKYVLENEVLFPISYGHYPSTDYKAYESTHE